MKANNRSKYHTHDLKIQVVMRWRDGIAREPKSKEDGVERDGQYGRTP